MKINRKNYNISELKMAIELYNESIKNYERLDWLSLNGIEIEDDKYSEVKDNERIMQQIAESLGIKLIKVSDWFKFFEPRLDPEYNINLEYYKVKIAEGY